MNRRPSKPTPLKSLGQLCIVRVEWCRQAHERHGRAHMHPLKTSMAKMLASLRESRWADRFGPVAVAIGIVLVAVGWIMEEESIGIGGVTRTLGGIVFLAGLATVIFGDARRRAAAIGMSKRVVARYMSRTGSWGWPDRVGLAGVIIGVALIVPALVLQIIFRNGAIVALPAVLLFWGGIFLLIYGRFHGRGETRTRDRSSSPSRREGRDRRRP